MDDIILTFKEKKLKLTPQRLAVYQYLKGTLEHPSAETIYKALQPNYPTMSLATVYKTLKTLVEIGLVQELNVGEGNFRYDANYHEHAHVQCVNCGKVEDIDFIDFSSLNNLVEEKTNYKIKFNKLFFYGECNEC
ncbi:Fur family transcriptional regulator [Clostridium celatum]|uniref:Transcriptional regulator, Fur family n=1 Tax=Clostridium celatum DSM 1785 TaxID=545697 RepID=L1QDM4_9CLOT|nr:Fur family transcriptional regulator [Clostridium celatum]EKY26084.1 transcriptional regulator, Fur family [Clostridium celatum DSM 1785]MCE9656101.1 transcriptional repressor [Clostridium celatum]MDU3722696.1 Fur family transcriptional regulator [Clostridium celatum]MDU6294734.1 Fur family transcriptional regulator [Clostridium celatum]MDY3361806.1 Fur family transcriptional regulator [Clostridium celatum]